jgi:hypothetical protein
MQESGLLRYTTLAVGREKSLYNLSVPGDVPLLSGRVCNMRPFDVRRFQRKINLRHRRKMYFESMSDLHECEPELESESEPDSLGIPQAGSTSSDDLHAIIRQGPSPYLLSLLRYEPARTAFIDPISATLDGATREHSGEDMGSGAYNPRGE